MAYTNIDDPSAYFQTAIYTGSNNQSITNDGNSDLQPDFAWIKRRSNADHHSLTNSSTGVNKQLLSSSSNAEQSRTDQIQSFNTDGFTLGTDGAGYTNVPGNTYVAWQWKANGGTTSSKSSGTVAGNVTTPCVQQVNTDAGFSILTYTASTSYAGTETHLEHGLGVGPRFLIVKRRDTAADWAVYHADNGGSPNAGYSYNLLNSTGATAQSSPTNKYWLNTPAESNATLLAFGVENGADGGEYVCYAFAEKQGYSKFGKYVGNGNSNGPFVYTGFRPAFVMIKRTDTTGGWTIYDNKRGHNGNNYELFPNSSEAEYTGTSYFEADILSNGFKLRLTDGQINASGGTYIYMAFAENPFTTSTGIPTTAR